MPAGLCAGISRLLMIAHPAGDVGSSSRSSLNIKTSSKYSAPIRKARGMRPVQLWVPDTRSADFAAECRRQSALLDADPQEREILDWIEQVADTGGWSA
jgi:hypothetical protein